MPTLPPALSFTGNRYIAQGVRKFYWVPTIATISSPTRAEMIAGTDLTGQISGDPPGWTVSTAFQDAPDFASRTVSKIAGAITFADSALPFYSSSNSVDVRSLLTQDLTGYIIILEEGDVPGQKMDVFKVSVASASKEQSISNPAQITVQFGIFAASVNVTIPA